jgi:hypothetical protein
MITKFEFEFDEYANKNISNLQVVDIILQVIANTINKNVVVADVRQNDRIIETVFPPRIGSSSEQVYILRNGEHFDGLIREARQQNYIPSS